MLADKPTYVLVDPMEQLDSLDAVRDAMIAFEDGDRPSSWKRYVAAIAIDAGVAFRFAEAMIPVVVEQACARLEARRTTLH